MLAQNFMCGKSVFARCHCNVLQPRTEHMALDSEEVRKRKVKRKKGDIGLFFKIKLVLMSYHLLTVGPATEASQHFLKSS